MLSAVPFLGGSGQLLPATWRQAFHDLANPPLRLRLWLITPYCFKFARSVYPVAEFRSREPKLPARIMAMGSDTTRSFELSARMEQLEDRLAMSADPLGGLLGGAIEHHVLVEDPPSLVHHQESTPDFWIENTDEELMDKHLWEIGQALANAHEQTGLSDVRSDFGFSGVGQTVAVIDSGIAYDHFALGGGFGENYRVVGGWDFTGENDADPYDDGPEGSHGTHVAGIVGGTGSTHTGVAPGVDLVGLRVFDDAGAGYFSWVESALNWVHDNRSNFENPITAVNLSLGVASWNSDSIPAWASLEDEFAQLEADGIFIAVSAGNSFSSFNEAGLSYPAASSYVVPVMSVDDNGNLSYFSQRHTRAIAAPGRTIVSTVPDYAGNENGITDDYASFSGTSMASPYVAGASVIIREAMEFAGYTNITQDTIYDHMMATADSFFDSVTNQWYSRLNMSSAISTLMPTDDYGSSAAAAYDLGTLSGTSSISGVIGELSDVDYFTFTAGGTGTVTFEAVNTTHDLQATWNGTGTVSGPSNEIYTINVIAGQDYTVGFGSSAGLGYFDLEVTAESFFTFTDWGSVSFTELEDIAVAGETWYRVEASITGYLTVEAMFDIGAGAVSLDLYSDEMQQIDQGNTANDISRVDTYATTGDEFYVCVLGSNVEVDFRLSNLVAISGTTVLVEGTSEDDQFSFAAGGTHTISVNGVSYDFAATSITDVQFDGGAGADSIVIIGTSAYEEATLHFGSAVVVGTGYAVDAQNVEQVRFYGVGGGDRAYMFDSSGDDVFVMRPNYGLVQGEGFEGRVYDCYRIYAYASEGYDNAYLYDSDGNDIYWSDPTQAKLYGTNFHNLAEGLDRTFGYSSGGEDKAYLNDSTGDDIFWSDPERAKLYGANYHNLALGFGRVYADASEGYDRAYFYDSDGDDIYWSDPNLAKLYGMNFHNQVENFDRTYGYASEGKDRAYLKDSAGDDVFWSDPERAKLYGANYHNLVGYFDRVYAEASEGYDKAYLFDSDGNDIYWSDSTRAKLYGANFHNLVDYFDRTYSYASEGNDKAYLNDSTGKDTFWSDATLSKLYGEGFHNLTKGFDAVCAYSENDSDKAIFKSTSGNDQITGLDNVALLAFEDSSVTVFDFEKVEAIDLSGEMSVDIGATDYLFELIGS